MDRFRAFFPARYTILLRGLSEEERERMRGCFDHIWRNIDRYFREDAE